MKGDPAEGGFGPGCILVASAYLFSNQHRYARCHSIVKARAARQRAQNLIQNDARKSRLQIRFAQQCVVARVGAQGVKMELMP
jgi:hypothetical protein